MDRDELVRLRRARDRMDREYDQPLDVDSLARGALMSSGHFSRRFRAAYGESPYGYLMTRRIERAAALLRRGDVSVTDACMSVGCTSLGSFSSSFTRILGVTPSGYRARFVDASTSESLDGLPCLARTVGRPVRIGEAPRVGPVLP